jgi:hypothetical protein
MSLRGFDEQTGVLAQDRLLQGDELRPRVHPQFGDQHPPQLTQRPQRLALLTRLVLGERQQLPTRLP